MGTVAIDDASGLFIWGQKGHYINHPCGGLGWLGLDKFYTIGGFRAKKREIRKLTFFLHGKSVLYKQNYCRIKQLF